MRSREAAQLLRKMLQWISQEQEKSTRVGGEPFIYMSLRYCATQAAHIVHTDELVRLVQITAKAEGGTTDVVRPHRAIFLINRTIVTLP